jgi:competence protein CoiA
MPTDSGGPVKWPLWTLLGCPTDYVRITGVGRKRSVYIHAQKLLKRTPTSSASDPIGAFHSCGSASGPSAIIVVGGSGFVLQYAIVAGERREATSGARGICPTCGAEMVAKCGPRIIHHWAHAGRRNCDPWWENETRWHREWKNLFPRDCREISHVAPGGEIHRADVRTPTGIYIEFQHSSMTDEERQAREAFYENLVWIVDGKPFRKNFDLYHLLPDPSSELAKDIVWLKAQRGMNGANAGIFWRRSENSGVQSDSGGLVQIRSYQDIKCEVEASYRGHQQYDWVRPRRTWLEANCPVYLDFGEDWLLRLEYYGKTQLHCAYRIDKRKFVHDVMTETRAEHVATRFGLLRPS